MSVVMNTEKILRRRLTILFLSEFLLCFVLWYSIEKAFMLTIGFNLTLIGIMAATYSAVSVIMEVPSGILADRWSRRGVLIIAALSLALSSWVASDSYSVVPYIIAMALWGVYDAFLSGTGEAIIYDSLIEAKHDPKEYQQLLSLRQIIIGTSLVLGSLLGAAVVYMDGMRLTFALTALPAILAVALLVFFKDTRVQHDGSDAKIWKHTKNTLVVVTHNQKLRPIIISIAAAGVIGAIIGEMYQTWYIAQRMPLELFGFAGAIIMCNWMLSGVLAARIKTSRHVLIAGGVIVVASVVLVVSRYPILTIATQVAAGMTALAVKIRSVSQLHDFLPSKYRAGSASAANMVQRLIFIPVIALFGWISSVSSVFVAGWIIVGFAVVLIATEIMSMRSSVRTT